jgi:nucleotide-binding universal stress UspA family protein
MLVGLDGSDRERGVFEAALGLARRTGARMLLFRSVGLPQHVPPEAYSMDVAELPALLERMARADLERIEQRIPTELRGGIHVRVGTPWQSIERTATEEDVDLVVVGSHGYGGLDRVLGTTAAKVVNHAPCAVLVVRAPERLSS